MYIALGYNCNHKCYFCPCGSKPSRITAATTESILLAIDEGINQRDVSHITLSGGEPTLHPGFHEILSYCINKQLSVTLLSNGDSFCQAENVERYFSNIELKNLHITTAIHSDHAELHDCVTRVRDSFKRTVQGLKNVIAKDIHVTVKQVISRWNYDRIQEFVSFVFHEFGTQVSVNLCGMDFCGMELEQINNVAIGYRAIQPYLEKALDHVMCIRRDYGAFPQFVVSDMPLCCVDPYYWRFFAKASRNELTQYSAPTGEDSEIISVNQIENECDVFFNKCETCCVTQYCPGVWRTAYAYFGENEVRSIHPA
jgi:MoaA/NifB/PqqE/SkfB family radical SAM enzyme